MHEMRVRDGWTLRRANDIDNEWNLSFENNLFEVVRISDDVFSPIAIIERSPSSCHCSEVPMANTKEFELKK